MARIRIILEDDKGRKLKDTEDQVYELGKDLSSLHDIEGALERFRRQVLPGQISRRLGDFGAYDANRVSDEERERLIERLLGRQLPTTNGK